MTRGAMDSVFSGKPLGSAMFNQVDGLWIAEESADCNHEPGPGGDIGEIGHPGMVRERGGEVPVQQVSSTFAILGGDRGRDFPATDQSVHPDQTHQPVDGVLRDTKEPVARQPRRHLPPRIEDLRPRPAAPIALAETVEHVKDAGMGLLWWVPFDGVGMRTRLRFEAVIRVRRGLRCGGSSRAQWSLYRRCPRRDLVA